MGMDLYKYRVTRTRDEADEIFIGEKTYNQSYYDIREKKELDDNYINANIELVRDKYNLDIMDIDRQLHWNFEVDKPFIAVFKGTTLEKIKEYHKQIDNLWDEGIEADVRGSKMDILYKYIEDEMNKLDNGENIFEYFNSIPTISNYYITNITRDEIGYCRKPWRDIKEQDLDLYRELLDSGLGGLKYSYVHFTHDHNDIFKKLIDIINCEYTKDTMMEMYPLKEGEIISIDW